LCLLFLTNNTLDDSHRIKLSSLLRTAIIHNCPDEVFVALLIEVANKDLPEVDDHLLKLIIDNHREQVVLVAAEKFSVLSLEAIFQIMLKANYFDDLVESLVSKFPAVVQSEKGKNTVLFTAISTGVSERKVRSILAAYKDAARQASAGGELALHLAIKRRYSDILIQEVLSAYPCAAIMRDKETRMLPLHLVAKSTASPELVESLITEYPEALDIPVFTKHCLPRYLVTPALPDDSIKMICQPSMLQDLKRKRPGL